MNKKAVSIIMMIIEILVVITAGVITTQIANSYASSDIVERSRIANDLELMVNVLVGIPSDAVVEYPEDVSGYVISLTSDKVSVFTKNENLITHTTRRYNLPEGFKAEGFEEGTKRVCLTKRNKVIFLEGCL